MRPRSTRLTLTSLSILAALALPAVAADGGAAWPSWRGPAHTGVNPDADPPVRWSEKEGINIRWKADVPGRGLSSPVIWGDRVFVLTATPMDAAAYERSQQGAADKQARQEWPPAVEPVAQRFQVLAYGRDDGELLWQKMAVEAVPHESHHIDASWASASPVTDGKRLIAHFGSYGTYAYDLEGEPLWQVDLGDMTTRNGFGEGSSPAMADGKVIINWDHEGDSFVVALDAATGAELWRTPRPGEVTSWATPLVVEVSGRKQVVIPATGKSRGYDLATGKELWSLGGMTVNTIPTPVHRDGTVYLASGYRGTMLQAVSLTKAQGEVEGTSALLWTYERDTPYVPSLLLYDNQIYFLKHFRNILTALDAATGEVRYKEQRLEAIHNVYASPVGAAGRVYVLDRDGHGVVLAHGPELKILAENDLAAGVDATPAIAGDALFVRAQGALYCLAETGACAIRAAPQMGTALLRRLQLPANLAARALDRVHVHVGVARLHLCDEAGQVPHAAGADRRGRPGDDVAARERALGQDAVHVHAAGDEAEQEQHNRPVGARRAAVDVGLGDVLDVGGDEPEGAGRAGVIEGHLHLPLGPGVHGRDLVAAGQVGGEVTGRGQRGGGESRDAQSCESESSPPHDDLLGWTAPRPPRGVTAF